jgi:hypothetical protein
MTISPAALRRAAAPYTSRVFRVFVGPPERFVDNAEFAAGEPTTLPLEAYTTEFVAFGTTPTDIDITDASGFPNTENVLNLSSARGSSWIRYESITGNTLENCTLIYGVDSHYTGAKVNQWVEITSRTFSESLSGEHSWDGEVTVDWEWQLSGEHYDSDLMPQDCTVLIMQSVKGTETSAVQWEDFFVTALGYVRNWDGTGDAKRQRKWSATVQSISTYLDTFQSPARVFGRVNLAEGQPVTASDALLNPLDLLTLDFPEWQNGVIGTTDADKLTDGFVDNGPYVSAIAPSETGETGGTSTGGGDNSPDVKIEEIFLGDDQNPTLQWMQLRLASYSPHYNTTGVSLTNFAISTKQTVFRPSKVSTWPREIPVGGGATGYIRLKDIALTSSTDRMVLTNNKQEFLSRYHVSSEVTVYDWREMPGFANDRNADGSGHPGKDILLDVDGDWMQLRYCVGLQKIKDMVVWVYDNGEWWNSTNDENESGDQWASTAGIAAPAVGTSVRRFPVSEDSNTDADWIEEEFPNPADRRTNTDEIHMSVELADIPTAISTNFTTTVPAADQEFPMTFPEYLRPTLSGRLLVVRVDTEKFLLKQLVGGEWVIIARDYDGTTAAAHTSGALVYYEHATLGFTRQPWVRGVELRRWERFDFVSTEIGGFINPPRTPYRFQVWVSNEASPRRPGETDYRLDWVNNGMIVEHINGGAAFVMNVDVPIMPARHVMIVGKRMNLDSTHWMCNEMRVWMAGMTNAANEYPGIGGVVYWYLDQLLDEDRIIIDDDVFDNTSGDVTIQGGALGTIIKQLGMQYGFIVQYTLDNKVRIRRNPFHPRAVRPDIVFENEHRTIAGTLNPQRANNPSRLGNQYVVNLHNTDALRVYTGVYPPSAPFGDIRELDITAAVGNQETANLLAQMMYLQDPQISRVLSSTVVGVFPEAEPLQRHMVLDFTDDAAYDGRWVDCVVTGVRYSGGREHVFYQEWRQA